MNWEKECKKLKRDNAYLRGLNEINTKRIVQLLKNQNEIFRKANAIIETIKTSEN